MCCSKMDDDMVTFCVASCSSMLGSREVIVVCLSLGGNKAALPTMKQAL